jgi:hypothetical protein
MILVQREFRVPAAKRADFEQQSSQGLWPAFLRFGAQMVAYGSWAFGGPGDVVVTNTCYVDFEHWEATRQRGAFYRDPAILEEIKDFLPIYEGRGALIEASGARLFELDDDVSRPRVFYRRAGQRLADPPPTFGRGSIVSERTLAIADGARAEFVHLSASVIWPWLESQGGRAIGLGHDLMGASNEITTWFAFPSLAEWHRCARPATAHAPAQVVDAWNARARTVRHQRGRLLMVGTDFGTHPE